LSGLDAPGPRAELPNHANTTNYTNLLQPH
jgi:hypothetical protein